MVDETLWDMLPISSLQLQLVEPKEFNRMAGGGSIAASLGDPYWVAKGTLARRSLPQARTYEARLSRLSRAGARLTVYDPQLNGPAADPGGILIEGASVTVAALNADGVSLRLAGLPGRYTITPGDYLGATISGVPHLFRAVTGVTSFAGGYADFFEVEPWLPAGLTVGTAVELIRPRFIGQVTVFGPPTLSRGRSENGSFTIEQVFD